ncbi:MAG: arginine--tRNA ligase [Deltaproteobacteria bacterium]|nr:arginine--tRNA ligase [Deltaproteobacteria bacterium]
MKSILQAIKEAFATAINAMLPEGVERPVPQIIETAEKKFGDYQSNIAMGLARLIKKPPREIAQDLVNRLKLSDVCEKIETAGPGFINLFIKTESLERFLKTIQADPRLGVTVDPEIVHHVIDFSSPNLAKEMHVGHLRTTVTGEVISRIIEFKGHTVERVNHVGDWGTQFGMLLQNIFENHPDVIDAPQNFVVSDLEKFYKEAKQRFDNDAAFAEKARDKVVLLQSRDATALKIWRAFVNESLRHCHALYKIMGVTLKDVGESFYNDRLPLIVEELKNKGLAVTDQGAVCVFLDGYKNRDGEPLPMIIKKSDGGYNYTTTDLAAIRHRILDLGARRLIYITDIRQAQHFEMFFKLARIIGWAGHDVTLNHIGYGMVLGPDKKPFKTREGGTVRLKDLIHEGIERSRALMLEGNADTENTRVRSFSAEKILDIATKVGLAAIKYSDLCHNLASDYVFSWDKMLAMDGNTGPYMLYAYTRIMGIGRKAGININHTPLDTPLVLAHPTEIALAKEIARFSDVIDDVAITLKPNTLTDYLYGLAKAFSSFYDKKQGVPVLDSQPESTRQSRLLLCCLTARTLKLGLNLLSIDVVEEM